MRISYTRSKRAHAKKYKQALITIDVDWIRRGKGRLPLQAPVNDALAKKVEELFYEILSADRTG